MKLYNPFKWHIIEQNGGYWIRKLSFGTWLYLENKPNEINTWLHQHITLSFKTLEDASVKLSKYPELLKKYKDHQKIKVHV